MSVDQLLITAFILTLGVMMIIISIVSYGTIIIYENKNKIKISAHVKRFVFVIFIVSVIATFISALNLDLKSLGF